MVTTGEVPAGVVLRQATLIRLSEEKPDIQVPATRRTFSSRVGRITIRGGGDPSPNMVIEPFVRMGPPPRSLAAEANDCFMVRTQHGDNRIQGCGAESRAQWQAPLGSFCYLSLLCHRPASADFRSAVMDCGKEDVAYEMPSTSKCPYKFGPLLKAAFPIPSVLYLLVA